MKKCCIGIAVKHHSIVKHFISGQMGKLNTFTIYLEIKYVHICSLLLNTMLYIGYNDFSRVKLSFHISPYSDNDWNEFDILKHSCFDCVFHSLLKLRILKLQIGYNILLEK